MSSQKNSAIPDLEVPTSPMPRLSRDLKFPRSVRMCQNCGRPSVERLPLWMEHEDDDSPAPVFVALCEPCSSRIIEPHPRLYSRMQDYAPMPGAMAICDGCAFMRDLACCHRDLKYNGGDGLRVDFPPPGIAFFDGRRGPKGGRRAGWHETIYTGPPTGCAGRAARDDES